MTLTKIARGRYVDGFQVLTDVPDGAACSLPVTSGVAIARGDVIIMTSGYMSLATTLAGGSDGYPTMYVALSSNTAAEASTNGAVNVTCIPISISSIRYMVPVTANAVLAQATHVGVLYNIDGSEDGLTVAAAVTANWGFIIEEIDISTEAIAYCTYGFAIGRFAWISETT